MRRLPAYTRLKNARQVLGVSIESGRLTVAALRRRNGHGQLTASFELGITPDQLLADPEQAGRTLAAALQEAGIRERRCALCLPPSWALTASVELPAVPPDD